MTILDDEIIIIFHRTSNQKFFNVQTLKMMKTLIKNGLFFSGIVEEKALKKDID